MGSFSAIIERWWLLTSTGVTLLFLLFLNNNSRNGVSVFLNLTLPKTATTDLSPMSSNYIANKEPEKSPDRFPTLDLPPGLQTLEPSNGSDTVVQPVMPSQFPSVDLENSRPPNFKAAKAKPETISSSRQDPLSGLKNPGRPKTYNDDKPIPNTTEKEMGGCNIFEGKWVYDPGTSPLYDSAMCPFLSHGASCQANGRPDKEYEKWRWEANECKIPRFDAKDLLKRLRGKRVVLVGDSIGFGQWESLACLLYSAISDKSHVDIGNRIFISKSHNLIVESWSAPFLVEDIVNKTNGKRILKLDSLPSTAWRWKGADILVFNSGHWWGTRGRWDGGVLHKRKLYTDMDLESAFKIAMRTWARWIEKNVDRTKTTVFFRSYSLGHSRCHAATQPIKPDEPITLHSSVSLIIGIVERTIQGMRSPVKYLNVTKLTGYRKDAHSSLYSVKKSTSPKPDCSHWCLPGVPDAWNHLLYATMVFESSIGITIS